MAVVLENLLANFVTVTILCGVVWLICRSIKKPAVAHCLWILLLVKLLTPSVIQLPFSLAVNDAWLPAVVSANVPALDPDIAASSNSSPSLQADSAVADSSADASTHGIAQSTSGPAQTAVVTTTMRNANVLITAARWLLLVWICGSVFYMAMLVWSQFRFSRFLRANEEIDVDLIGEGYNLAWQMGLQNPPRVRILRGALSPMLCGFGRGVTLIIPAELSDRLSRESRATLIVHELAHFLRRDHWVRVLEVAVTIVFWWNPVVWFIRNQIEAVEEECCDARVVSQFPSRPRQYAEALLDTIDFLAERRVVMPPMACGLGTATLLRRRLTQIMSGPSRPQETGRSEKCVLFLSAVLIVPLNVIQFQSPQSFQPEVAELNVLPLESANELDSNLQLRTAVSPVEPDESSQQVVDPSGRFALIRSSQNRWLIQNRRDSTRRELSIDGITCATFVSAGTLTVGTESGEITTIDCSDHTIKRTRRFSNGIRSMDWSDAQQSLAMIDDAGGLYILRMSTRSIKAYRTFADTSVNAVRFNHNGQRLIIATGDRRTEDPGAVLLLDSETLLEVERRATPNAVAVAEFTGDSGEVIAYEWSGRVSVMSPNPLTSVAVRWLPKDAASFIAFSSQTDHARFVPERF